MPVLPDGWTLVALQSVGSTNDEGIRLADTGAAEGTVVWAREQSGGRGRRGGGVLKRNIELETLKKKKKN